MIKLNIGCGMKQYPDFINIDLRDLPGVDMVHDLREPLLYPDNSVDYIIAEDVLEHMQYTYTDQVFADWCRVLKKGGKLKIIVPNIDAHLRMYQTKEIEKGKPVDLERLRHLIFGDQKYNEGAHYTTFNAAAVEKLYHDNKMTCNIKLSQKGIIAEGAKL